MTVDDESSVYVGGLSYDTTEDSLRKTFEEYGSVVAVKIILDRESGSSRGYGFVTFSTPRAATKAINGMDGGLLNGRTVRVNEVMNKGGRAFGRDNGFRERDRDRDNREFRSRDRSGNIRQFSPQRNRRLSPGSLHSNRGRLPMRRHSRSPQGGYSPSRSSSPLGKRNNHSSLSPSPRSSDRLQGADILPVGLAKIGRRGDKERGLDLIKVKDELEKANQRRDELSIKVASLEEENELKEQQIIELRNKSQKLENAVSNAVTASSQRQIQLRKLQKAFLQVRDYTERLQQSEKELQALIDVTGIEANDAGIEFQENHGRDLEDIEWKADDRGHINIDD